MIIWLITIGEPIPHEANKLRLHRTGIIANYLSEDPNHKIVWWTSTFSHFTKKHIYNSTKVIKVKPNYELVAIHGKGYSFNVSIDRIIDHKQIAQRFFDMAMDKEKPTVIIAAFPTLELCEKAIAIGKSFNIPVIIDYRDMWPEVFTDLLPKKLQNIGKLFLFPLFKRTQRVFKEATGLIGITEPFLNNALKKANRKKKNTDAVFPLAYLLNQFSSDEYAEAKIFWAKLKVEKPSNLLRICFFGSFSYQVDLNTVIDAVKELEHENCPLQLILCGTGDKLEMIKKKSSGLKSIIIPGFMDAAQIRALMDVSDIGLVPFYPKEAYLNTVPGKAIEYFSAGLPILSSLKDGFLGRIVTDNIFGYHYTSGSVEDIKSQIKLIIQHKSEGILPQNKTIIDFYTDNFDSENTYSDYIKYIKQIVNDYYNKPI